MSDALRNIDDAGNRASRIAEVLADLLTKDGGPDAATLELLHDEAHLLADLLTGAYLDLKRELRASIASHPNSSQDG